MSDPRKSPYYKVNLRTDRQTAQDSRGEINRLPKHKSENEGHQYRYFLLALRSSLLAITWHSNDQRMER